MGDVQQSANKHVHKRVRGHAPATGGRLPVIKYRFTCGQLRGHRRRSERFLMIEVHHQSDALQNGGVTAWDACFLLGCIDVSESLNGRQIFPLNLSDIY